MPLLQADQQKRVMSDPSVFGMGCYDKDTACGIILYTLSEENMLLRILYVAVSLSYQGQGVATRMIKSLAGNAYEEGYITLANFFAKDKDDPRYAMFDNTSAFSIEQVPGGVYVVSCDQLKDVVYRIPAVEYEKGVSGTRTTIVNSSSQTKKLIYDLFKTSGMDLSQSMPYIDESLSYAVIDQEGAPTSLVVISYFEEQHMYEISFVTSTVPDQISDMMNIITFAVSDISDKMDEQDLLRFSTAVESVDRLAEKYFSKELKTESFYRAGYNGDSVI